jgi:signal transduction histidine kinase
MKVLAADDDAVSLRMLQAALTRWGHEVVAVRDGHAAWKALLEDLDIVVAIIDWGMPGVDGVELCRLAREAFTERSIYLILLTGRTGTEDLVEGFTAGADDYVTKPFRADELRARVDVGLRIASLQRSVNERFTALEAAERRYRELIEDLDVIVWEAELETWRYQFVSRRATQVFGESALQLVQDPHAWLSRVVPADRPTVEAFRRELVEGAAHATCEYRMLDDSGAVLFLRDLARPAATTTARGPRRVRGVTIDTTLQRQAREQLQAAIKMQADFVSFASHQLRTPLTGIKWMLELALAEPEGSPDLRGFVSDSLEASERLIGLVNDLLSISRLEGGRFTATPAVCDLGELTSQVVSDLHPVAFKQEHALSFFGLNESSPILADVQLIRQVLQNLLSNAIKYTPKGGRIWIAIEPGADEIRWSVTDNGIGVPEEARPRLFEKFFRADNVTTVETEGTGLGLYMVRLIVERAQGRIAYEPVKDGGSRFVLTMPRAPQTKTTLMPTMLTPAPPTTTTETTLPERLTP